MRDMMIDLAGWLADEQPPLWEIELRDASNSKETAVLIEAARGSTVAGDSAERWAGLAVGEQEGTLDVQVEWQGDAWRLEVQNRSQEYGIWRVDFPRLRFRITPEARTVLPMGWGVEFRGAHELEAFHGDYPNGHCPMQWLCLSRDADGLYLAAHDGEGYHKSIHCVPEVGTALVSFSHYPEPMGEPARDYALPYPVVAQRFEGDWLQAAKLYRSWAQRGAMWFPDQSLAEDRQVPAWLKEIPLWCQTSGAPEAVVPKVKRFVEYFQMPVAVHWYNWHQIPFDNQYPEYFPPKEGFREAVAEIQSLGARVVPYINGRLFDAATQSWRDENAEAYCALGPDGEPYQEVYGSSPPLTPMCPTMAYWQGKVAGIVERLVGEYGVDGVYIDQIASAGVRPCFNPNHPHPVGDGRFWVRGYREMLRKVRERLQKLNPQAAIVTEDAAEPYGGLIDAYLMCNRTRSDQIPAYPAVYGGHYLTFGRYLFPEDARRSLPFLTKVTEMFVFGAQMGWLDAWILETPAEAAYLKALAQVRLEARSWLALGELVGLPEVSGAIPRLETVWQLWGTDHDITMPAIQGSAWRAPDGTLAVVFANAHKDTIRFDWRILDGEFGGAEEMPGRSALVRQLP